MQRVSKYQFRHPRMFNVLSRQVTNSLTLISASCPGSRFQFLGQETETSLRPLGFVLTITKLDVLVKCRGTRLTDKHSLHSSCVPAPSFESSWTEST